MTRAYFKTETSTTSEENDIGGFNLEPCNSALVSRDVTWISRDGLQRVTLPSNGVHVCAFRPRGRWQVCRPSGSVGFGSRSLISRLLGRQHYPTSMGTAHHVTTPLHFTITCYFGKCCCWIGGALTNERACWRRNDCLHESSLSTTHARANSIKTAIDTNNRRAVTTIIGDVKLLLDWERKGSCF